MNTETRKLDRAHDRKLIETLSNASFREVEISPSEIEIHYAHLVGFLVEGDGGVSWSASGKSDRFEVDIDDPEGSFQRAVDHCRASIKTTLIETATRVIADAKKRLEADQA